MTSKEKKKEYDRRYYEKHLEQIKLYQKEYYENNKDKIKKNTQKYNKKNSEKIKKQHKEYLLKTNFNQLYYKKNIEKELKRMKLYKIHLKTKAFQKIIGIGSIKCQKCGEINLNCLTIEHLNNDGKIHRNKFGSGSGTYSAILTGKISEEELKTLKIYCYNCNCSKLKSYFSLPKEKQTKYQRQSISLWSKAYSFFNPSCKTCGNSELAHLTISHIHNDGAELRKNGQKGGASLLKNFNKMKWPQSLKKDYCLECYNCNCERRI